VTFDLDQGMAVLERTPRVLRAWLLDLPPEWLAATEGPETWSPFDVVGHLISGEETDWIPRARVCLEGDGQGRFAPFDRFRNLQANRDRPLAELLDRFAELRAANLATLRGFALTSADLERTAIHPEFGTVTLAQHLATWVAHDLDHVVQIARVMAKRYREDVGPWRAYLRVVRD
jgi:hypothetical protein